MGLIVDDIFTEAVADVALPSHTMTPIGSGWAELDRDSVEEIEAKFVTDQAGVDSTTGSSKALYTAADVPDNADYDVALEIVTVPGSADDALVLLLRVADSSNYYYAIGYRSSANPDLRIGKVVAGVVTNLSTANVGGLTAIAEFRFRVRGSTLSIRRDDVEALTASDGVLTAKGLGGWGMGNVEIANDDVGSPWRLDRFLLDEVPAAGGGVPSVNASLL